jgi:pimeloyl-ACP methyl ester carboxylesterase
LTVDGWATNGSIRLHYLDNECDVSDLPLIMIPGLSGKAAVFQPMIEALTPYRALSVSLRGRGKSDVPDTGYRFEDHVKDIEAIIEQAQFHQVCLFGHSIGINYAIGYALENPDRVKGIIVGGYPAEYPVFTADWALKVMMKYPDELPMKAVLGIQHESVPVSFWERLSELTCSILILRGNKPSSLLQPEIAEKYIQYAPQSRILVFDNSGHRLWHPNLNRFVTALRFFIEECSTSKPVNVDDTNPPKDNE